MSTIEGPDTLNDDELKYIVANSLEITKTSQTDSESTVMYLMLFEFQ